MAKKKLLTCEIRLGDDRYTQCAAENIDDLLEKIKSFHTLGEFEREYFTSKGTLTKEVKSGWYLK